MNIKRTDVFTELAKRIESARRTKGYNQKQLAERVGVTPGTISRIEHAHHHVVPHPEVLIAIARVLDIEACDLFATLGWMPKDQLPTFEPYLHAKYGGMPEAAYRELTDEFTKVARRYGFRSS